MIHLIYFISPSSWTYFHFFWLPFCITFFDKNLKIKKSFNMQCKNIFLISTIPLSNTPACHIDIGIPKWYFGALAPLCCFCIIPKKNKRRQKPWEKLKVNRAELYFLLVIAFFFFWFLLLHNLILLGEKKNKKKIDRPPTQCSLRKDFYVLLYVVKNK